MGEHGATSGGTPPPTEICGHYQCKRLARNLPYASSTTAPPLIFHKCTNPDVVSIICPTEGRLPCLCLEEGE
jgi:hypothetical protein